MSKNISSPQLSIMRHAIDQQLALRLNDLASEYTQDMIDMISYHLGWEGGDQLSSGKRIRPLLTLLSCAALGGDWEAALPIASSIELIHNFSLVHDDIEDNSETRRGRPTIWKRWGIAKAINIGDAIFVLSRLSSYELSDIGIPHDRILRIMQILDEACLELTIGQQMDLDFEELVSVELETYLRMIKGKTAALVAASTECGATIAGAKDDLIKTLSTYGHHLGLAFQIRDDILGIWGESARTGKSTGDDLRARKKTLPILYGMNRSQAFRELWEKGKVDEESLVGMRKALEDAKALAFARERAEIHTQSALEALFTFDGLNPFHQELVSLTHSLLDRDQ
jgi:geranylgeranyl diphosphate synthase type I